MSAGTATMEPQPLTGPVPPPVPPAEHWLQLSAGEKEIAAMYASGVPIKEIMAHRKTTRKTVDKQVTSIYCKLGIRSRIQLCRAAYRAGILKP